MKKTWLFFSLLFAVLAIQLLSLSLNFVLGVDIPYLVYDVMGGYGHIEIGPITLEGFAYAYSEGSCYFLISLVIVHAVAKRISFRGVLLAAVLAELYRWVIWWRWDVSILKDLFSGFDDGFDLGAGVFDARFVILGLISALIISLVVMVRRKSIESKLLFTANLAFIGMLSLLHALIVSYGFYYSEEIVKQKEEWHLKRFMAFLTEDECREFPPGMCTLLNPQNVEELRKEHVSLDNFLSDKYRPAKGIFSYHRRSDDGMKNTYYVFNVQGVDGSFKGMMLAQDGGMRHDVMHPFFAIFFILMSAFSFVWLNGFLLLLVVHSRLRL